MDDWLRVDTHVHLHQCFEDGAFLDFAADNLEVQESGDKIRAALCLTETHGINRFSQLATSAGADQMGESGWSILCTNERNSLVALDARGRTMAIIAGRQIECLEGIEVLAIGLVSKCSDGHPVRDVLRMVDSAGAIPVIPWGFLKWLGRRGRIVDDLLRDAPCKLSFGDNGSRLAYTAEPRHLVAARRKGIPVLPGTDPFPFSWDINRAGSFGLECVGSLSNETPYSDLYSIFANPEFLAKPFGRRLKLLPFIRNQVAIQLRKRLRSFSA